MYISELKNSKSIDAPENVLYVFELLDRLKISYEYVENDVVNNMDESSEVAKVLDCEIRKSVFLTNQKKTAFYLLIIPADKRFDTKEFRDALGISRLSFASPELMEEKIGVKPGTASLFCLTMDTDKEVELILDMEILNDEYFGVNPGDNRYHLKLRTEDVLKKIIPELGYSAELMSLKG